ncbi:helix-turn-helix domain-containing protein [Isobaculum melis]|uniref:Mga helix-turn-helix domain-containing protein n=1 Tax=Isobaculum melis TaxID=142588 RepID=A0A1H9PTK5_9LACT|nr:helix-turn-helix domain-containing protein [Isobaculum melis]SER51544.1 Mga helix-turn-helix domain-containing protein [Isobaculum melis]
MKHFFMQAIDIQKHNILKSILLNEHGIGAKYIMDKFGISSTSTHRFIHAINHDLTLAFPNDTLAIVLRNNSYHINSTNTHQNAFVLDTLQVYYVQHSIEYNIIHSLLTRRYMSVGQLALELNISSSQLYKYLKGVRKMLQLFHIKIEFNHHKKQTNLTGNEIHIQFFLCQLYWHLFKGLTLPFKKLSLQTSEDILKKFPHLLPSQAARIQYIFTISEWSAARRKHPVKLEKEFVDILLSFEHESTYTSKNFLMNKSHCHPHEQHLYHFLLCCFVADLDTDEQKVLIAKRIISQSTPLAMVAQQLLNYMLEQFSIQLPDTSYYIYYYYLMITIVQLKYVGVHYHSMYQEEEDFLTQTAFVAVEEALTRFFMLANKKTSTPYPFDITENNLHYLVFFFHPFLTLQMKKKRELLICLHISKKLYLNYLLKQQLMSIFGEENIVFTRDITVADLIISDTLQEDTTFTNFFFFDDIYDDEAWNNLLVFITSMLQKRYSFNQNDLFSNSINQDYPIIQTC